MRYLRNNFVVVRGTMAAIQPKPARNKNPSGLVELQTSESIFDSRGTLKDVEQTISFLVLGQLWGWASKNLQTGREATFVGRISPAEGGPSIIAEAIVLVDVAAHVSRDAKGGPIVVETEPPGFEQWCDGGWQIP
jgi:hypothetical protein